jgi:hypothetical protein
MKINWALVSLLTPLGGIRAFWLWRGYKYGWVIPSICLILWTAGLALWYAKLLPFWLVYIFGMVLSGGSITVSNWILKLILPKHIFVRWDATRNLESAWRHLANLLAVHPNKEIALDIFGEGMRCFEFIKSTSPFVRNSFRPNPPQLNDPTEETRDGWLNLVFADRDLAIPKYLALGPEIEAAVSKFYFLFSMATPVKSTPSDRAR